MREPDSSGASGDIDQASLTDFLLSGDDDLLVAVQAGTDLHFLADGPADFHPARVDALAVRRVDEHIRRTLWVGHDRLARDRQGPNLGGSEYPGFGDHACQQH